MCLYISININNIKYKYNSINMKINKIIECRRNCYVMIYIQQAILSCNS